MENENFDVSDLDSPVDRDLGDPDGFQSILFT